MVWAPGNEYYRSWGMVGVRIQPRHRMFNIGVRTRKLRHLIRLAGAASCASRRAASGSSRAQLADTMTLRKPTGAVSFLAMGDWGRQGELNQRDVAQQMARRARARRAVRARPRRQLLSERRAVDGRSAMALVVRGRVHRAFAQRRLVRRARQSRLPRQSAGRAGLLEDQPAMAASVALLLGEAPDRARRNRRVLVHRYESVHQGISN